MTSKIVEFKIGDIVMFDGKEHAVLFEKKSGMSEARVVCIEIKYGWSIAFASHDVQKTIRTIIGDEFKRISASWKEVESISHIKKLEDFP